ncbi:helix-turn-helix domain-containing protein [Jeotgalibacillus sp. S-D1]|uniref:excisionase family DNA-binding protein n=1 Tax=Jeotgalibacillus sp. S-D1 TaxID=2552189 RepID=UPI001059C0A0|nr:excisionase family DNA-binding protein [Jeotgalibacillus sp. S-D1]TDL31777.1 helix-turn-helix domain-containing protein [Jeotgalibacillus sp. S-D1]
MYLTVKETAEYLSMQESVVAKLVHEGKIRAVHDGDQYVINKDQFQNHLDQVEKAKKQFEEWRNEPIPESVDVKDED